MYRNTWQVKFQFSVLHKYILCKYYGDGVMAAEEKVKDEAVIKKPKYSFISNFTKKR